MSTARIVSEMEGRHVVEAYHKGEYRIGRRIDGLADLFSKPEDTTHALLGHMSISHEILEVLPPGEYRTALDYGYGFWGVYIPEGERDKK